MSDFIKNLLCLSDAPAAASSHERRQAMNQLVKMLLAMAETGGDDARERALVIRLTEIIGDLTGKIAQADDATFSAIVKEAAMLVQSLQQRHAGGTAFRIH